MGLSEWEGTPIEMIPGVPKDVEGLRNSLLGYLGAKPGATQYGSVDSRGKFTPGRLSAGTNPLQARGASILSNLGGKGDYVPATGHEYAHSLWNTGGAPDIDPGPPINRSMGASSAPSNFVQLGMSQYPGAIKKRKVAQ